MGGSPRCPWCGKEMIRKDGYWYCVCPGFQRAMQIAARMDRLDEFFRSFEELAKGRRFFQKAYSILNRLEKDLRPPRDWFEECVEETGNPRLCGWVFYRHLKPRKPESKREPDKPITRQARARKRKWLRARGEE